MDRQVKEKLPPAPSSTLGVVIYLAGHDDHPDQKHQADDPEGEDGVPFTADGVLFQPGERVERDAGDFLRRHVCVAGAAYVALNPMSVQMQIEREDEEWQKREVDGKSKGHH